MYQQMTFETILKRMLSKVPSTMDKRQGSIIYDALAPAAAELAQMYIELDTNINLAFATTAWGEYLEKRTAEMGITRHLAINSKRTGLFYGNNNEPIDVPLDSRFTAGDLNFVVKEKLSTGRYILECEIAGAEGNRPQGKMIPIDYIPGLVKAELTDILLPGEEEESDKALLHRYQLRVRQPTTSGNIYHYKQWALDVAGVGDAKVFPLWNGPGTVKVVVVDSDKQPAASLLLTEVTQKIEEFRPVGANVTVVSGIGKSINVSATVTLASGYTIQNAQDDFIIGLDSYLKETAFKTSYISYAKIGTILLNTPGLLDYTNLIVNNTTSNIALEDEEMPVLGAVELAVM